MSIKKFNCWNVNAISIYANNCIFPLANAIVEGEKKESWCWSLQLLKRDLKIMYESGHEFTFISNKQKGLISAFNIVLPGVDHRFCVRQLHGNMKVARFQGKALKDFFGNVLGQQLSIHSLLG